MSELKFQVGDVFVRQDGIHGVVWEIDETNPEGYIINHTWDKYGYYHSGSPSEIDIIRILGNVSDFARLRDLEARHNALLESLKAAMSEHEARVEKQGRVSADALFLCLAVQDAINATQPTDKP